MVTARHWLFSAARACTLVQWERSTLPWSARHCLEWLSSEQKIMRAAGKQKLSIKTTSVQTQNTTLQLNSLLKYPTFLKH